MERKIGSIMLVGLIAGLLQCSRAFACSEPLPETSASFLTSKLIAYPSLRDYIRTEGDFDTSEGDLVEKYRSNLLEWQQIFRDVGIYANLDDLAFLVYELDERTLSDVKQGMSVFWKLRRAFRNSLLHPDFSGRNRITVYDWQGFSDILTARHSNRDKLKRVLPFFYTSDDEKLEDIIGYLDFAKEWQYESYDQQKRSWEESQDTPIFKRSFYLKTVTSIEKEFDQISSDAIKMRYAYQLIRLAHYWGAFSDAVALYDLLVPPLKTNSIIRYWAMEQKAGALRGLQREAEALYYYSIVFDHAPERREVVRRSLRILDFSEDLWRQAYTFAKTPREKAGLWILWTIYYGDRNTIAPLSAMAEIAPRSSFLESLLLWHLKNHEQHGFLRSFLGRHELDALDLEYLAEFKNFTLNTLQRGNVRRPAVWHLAAGYLAFMESFALKNEREALSYLKQAEAEAGGDLVLLHQARLFRHLIELRQIRRIDSAFETSLLPELQWLASQQETILFQSVMFAMGQKYLLQNDLPKAICCFFRSQNLFPPNAEFWDDWLQTVYLRGAGNMTVDVYATSDDIEALHVFVMQSSPSPFALFLLQDFPLSREQILDTWGTHLLRENRFDEAQRVFERISPAYWEDDRCGSNNQGESFCLTTSFFDNPHHHSHQFSRMNKAVFANALVELQRRAREEPANAAQYYWQIANGLYNSPFWGYAGVVWDGGMIETFGNRDIGTFRFFGEFHDETVRRESVFLNAYGTHYLAKDYYEKALMSGADDELAAEMLAVSQLCNIRAFTRIHGYGEKLPPAERDYFRLLHERYANTAFHQRLLEECPQFKEYVRQHF